eukprot:CAMPEP_0194686506 /NCGR_PEP_ID=MMETSP0295-20121207/15551_1 /TAXON_ID=39354 /ORGANISM="Heterosigma akashiwo, Strain CCMP2393" /LENGTH=66 /DNA_ID=CAMNT_0039574359 /DNA_START=774 /DNA_END=974 /DNA_ORIENTATION=-
MRTRQGYQGPEVAERLQGGEAPAVRVRVQHGGGAAQRGDVVPVVDEDQPAQNMPVIFCNCGLDPLP